MKTALALFLLAVPAAPQGSFETYCQSSPNSFGTAARIGCAGSLDLSDNTFCLTVTGCPPCSDSFGMFVCGTQPYNVPFGNGTLCVMPFYPGGLHRMGLQPLGPGMLTCGMQDRPTEFTMFQPGTTWHFQFWYRNPAGGGSGFNLSDGLRVTFAAPPN